VRLLDTGQLEAMAAGAPQALLAIVSDFEASGRKSLAALEGALAHGRWREARDLLHQLKGAAGTIGLSRLREICAECETQVGAETLPTRAGELGALLTESVAAACAHLNGG
jgi:HPt (histidine-containing phosphotransfer) domain-containing protein